MACKRPPAAPSTRAACWEAAVAGEEARAEKPIRSTGEEALGGRGGGWAVTRVRARRLLWGALALLLRRLPTLESPWVLVGSLGLLPFTKSTIWSVLLNWLPKVLT